jgi:translocation and assembly module TamB
MTRKRIIGWIFGSIASLIVVAAAGGFLLLRSRGFHNYVLARIVDSANQATGGKVEIHDFDFRLSNLTANVYGLVIHGTEPNPDNPLLSIDHAYLDLKLVSLIHRKVDLNEIVVTRPVVHFFSDKNGRSNLPQPKTPKDENSKPINVFDLGIHHVLLTDGEVYYNQEVSPLNAELHQLRVEVKYQLLSSEYTGSISYRGGVLKLAKMEPLPHSLDVNFTASPSQIGLSSAILQVANSRAELNGNVTDFGNPKAEAHYKVLVHTQDFQSMVSDTSSAAGDIVLNGSLRYQNVVGQPALRNVLLEGKLESRELQVVTPQAHLPVRAIHSNYRLAGGNVEATAFTADLLGGHLMAELHMLHVDTTPAARFHADVRGISLGVIRQSALNPQIRTAPLNGSIDAGAEGSWTGSINTLKAKSDASLKAAVANDGSPNPVPMNGVLHVNYDGTKNIIALNNSYFRTPKTTIDLNGALGDHSNLRLDARASDLNEFAQLAAALGQKAQVRNLGGTANLSAIVQGSMQRPQINARLVAQDVQVESGRWRKLQMNLEADSSHVALTDGSLLATQKGEATFSANVALAKWRYFPSSQLNAKLNAKQLQIKQLLQLAGKDMPVDGILAVEVSLEGSQLSPTGNGSLQITQAVAYEQPIENVDLKFQATGDIVNSKLQVKMAPGNSDADIILHPKTKAYEIRFNSPGIKIAELEAVKAKNLPATGTVIISANGRGTFDNPQLTATISIPQLQVRQATLNQVKADLNVANQKAELNLGSEVVNSYVQGHATIDLRGANYTTASFDTKGISLAPLIALYKPVPEEFRGVLELHATAKGPLKNKDQMEAHVAIPTFNVAYQQLQIANAGPIKADYSNSVVTIAPSELHGTGTSLKFNGQVPLKGSAPPQMTVKGSVNLELLRIVSPEVRSAGQLSLDLQAVRAAEGIGVQGQIKLQNASLSTVTAPLGIENANGTFNIQNNEVRIAELSAQIGGGQLTAGGSLTYKPQLRFNVALKAAGIRVRYPEGVRAVLDSDLSVNGTADDSAVTGRVLIDNVSFTQDFDLGDFIGQFTGNSSPPSGEGMTQNMKLNISVQTTSRLNLVSSTVSIQGQANLRIIGTAAEPVIVGRADLTGGEIFLMNKRYQLVRGILNFNNPNKTEPVVNVVVNTTVDQYNLNLTFIGPIDRLRTSYTSDPPLPPVDIINLLARGQTTEEAAPANLNANSILAQGLASQVSGRIQKLAGLSSLQIDPTIGGNGTDPTARIAIQQRVTKNFIFTFSTDVTDPESQVIQGEYQINNRWSVSAARTQYGGYAFDAKYHRVF